VKRIFAIAGALLIAVITAWLFRYFYLRHVYVITDNAFQMADIVNVSTQDVSGKLLKLFKDEFQPVKKGEPLFKVDDKLYRKELESEEERLLSLRARKRELLKRLSRLKEQLPALYRASLENLKSIERELASLKKQEAIETVNWETSVEKAKSEVKSAVKALEAAKTSFEYWRSQLERYGRLYRRRVISREQFERVNLSFKRASSELEAARSSLEVARQNLRSASSLREKVEMVKEKEEELSHRVKALREEVRVKRAALAQVDELKSAVDEVSRKISAEEKNVERLKVLLSRTAVRSPISGFVARKWREVGDFVSPGLPVYSLYSPESFYVLAWVDEDKVSAIDRKSRVKAYLETCSGEFDGKVISIGTSAGSTFALIPRDTSQGDYTKVTQRVPVRIKLYGVPVRCIKPGTNVTVMVEKR